MFPQVASLAQSPHHTKRSHPSQYESLDAALDRPIYLSQRVSGIDETAVALYLDKLTAFSGELRGDAPTPLEGCGGEPNIQQKL